MVDYRTMFELIGKTALVVGAGSGIGQASAVGLAAFGAQVVCADLKLSDAQATVHLIEEAGGKASALLLDMRDGAAIRTAVAQIGVIDVLVCTPSINVRKPLLQISDDEFDRVVNLNLRGTFLLLREVGKVMAQQNYGSIIVFSSIRGQVVEPGQSVYAATKAGVVQMVRALAAELGAQGVRANAIAPGVVETPLTVQIKSNPTWYQAYADKSILKRWAQPSEMVGAVIYLASEASAFVTGSVFYVDGGWTAADGRFDPPL
ncbi:MAG: SDR family NAD(P)-dependent oxidoreductase [Chloroflexi bacterium]|nr:SDR family NAD(P)-dependent oxidoreductase [Chloroflexota bacterium]